MGYVAKIEGVTNLYYTKQVLNVFLVMCASGDKKCFECLPRNLCGVYLRHMQRNATKKRDRQFINLIIDELVSQVCGNIDKISKLWGDPDVWIIFLACIGATILAKSIKLSISDRAVVKLSHKQFLATQ